MKSDQKIEIGKKGDNAKADDQTIHSVKIIERYIQSTWENDEDPHKEYHNLCVQLKNDQLANIKNLLEKLNDASHLLGSKTSKLVDVILNMDREDWTNLPLDVLDEYLKLATSISVTGEFCDYEKVVAMLIRSFQRVDVESEQSRHIHQTLAAVLKSDLGNFLVDHKDNWFPVPNGECRIYVNCSLNLLKLTESYPKCKPVVLQVLIKQLMSLNAWVQDVKYVKGEEINQKNANLYKTKDIFESLLLIMFKFCERHIKAGPEVHSDFYHDMLSTFDYLATLKSKLNYVPYLLLYTCHTRPVLYEHLIKKLLDAFSDDSLRARKLFITGRSAIYFLARVLGDAQFVPINIVLHCLERICEWIHKYIDSQMNGETALASNICAHENFYLACHAVFFVIYKRKRQLKYLVDMSAELQILNLDRVTSCELDPIRICHYRCRPACLICGFVEFAKERGLMSEKYQMDKLEPGALANEFIGNQYCSLGRQDWLNEEIISYLAPNILRRRPLQSMPLPNKERLSRIPIQFPKN